MVVEGSQLGVLSRLFGGRRSREAAVERAYVRRLIDRGVPERNARALATDLLNLARARLQGRDDPTRSSSAGDRLLAQEATNEAVRKNLRRMRDDGARDEDIRSWWNLSDFERCVIQLDDELSRATVFVQKREEEGLGTEQAAAAVRKVLPIYGTLRDAEKRELPSGEDRPLTPELHGRINAWVRRRSQEDRATLQSDIDASTSMNALIRRELRDQRL